VSKICGIDYSTRAVDVVLLDEDTDAATWYRFDLVGRDAFERARGVRRAMGRVFGGGGDFDNVLAVGLEEPRGYNSGSLYRIQGAILACLPRTLLVQPWVPSEWRKAVGLPGNASKVDVFAWTARNYPQDWHDNYVDMCPQDAIDAQCLALATRNVLQHTEAA
jgi:hypothetical protein